MSFVLALGKRTANITPRMLGSDAGAAFPAGAPAGGAAGLLLAASPGGAEEEAMLEAFLRELAGREGGGQVAVLVFAPGGAGKLGGRLREAGLSVEELDAEGGALTGGRVFVCGAGTAVGYDPVTGLRVRRGSGGAGEPCALGVLARSWPAVAGAHLAVMSVEGGLPRLRVGGHGQAADAAEGSNWAKPAGELAGEVAAMAARAGAFENGMEGGTAGHEGELERIVHLLERGSGQGFGHYRREVLARRALERMLPLGVAGWEAYARLLESEPAETQRLRAGILGGGGDGFRELGDGGELKEVLAARLAGDGGPGRERRVWVPACGSGEEAYGLALLFSELMGSGPEDAGKLTVFASDMDEAAVQRARRGRYGEEALDGLAADLRERYFERREDVAWEAGEALKEKILFARQDVLRDPPFARLDLICCRNLPGVFERSAQSKLLTLFHRSLRAEGYLLLGPGESADAAPYLFRPVKRVAGLYRARPVETPVVAEAGGSREALARRRAAERREGEAGVLAEAHRRLLQENLECLSLLVGASGKVLHVLGPSEPFLRVGEGAPSAELDGLLRPEFKLPARAALYAALEEETGAEPVRIEATGGGEAARQRYRVTARRAGTPAGSEPLVLVTLAAAGEAPGEEETQEPAARGELQRELVALRRQLQIVMGEHEKSMAELQTANRELQASNRELQRTGEQVERSRSKLQEINEALEASEEEAQATNEELSSLNKELNALLEENREKADILDSLLESAEEHILFFDRELRVQRASRSSLETLGGRGAEAVQGLRLRELSLPEGAAGEVEGKLAAVFREGHAVDEVLSLKRDGGGEAVFEYRLSPLFKGGQVSTVVAIARDVTRQKQHEAEITGERNRLVQTLESIGDGFVTLTRELAFSYLNPAAERLLGVARGELTGAPVEEGLALDGREAGFRGELEKAVRAGEPRFFEAFERRINRWLECKAYPAPEGLSLFFRDITEEKMRAFAEPSGEERLRQAISGSQSAFWEVRFDAAEPYERPPRMFVSASRKRLLGFGEGEIGETLEAWMERVDPEQREGMTAAMERQLRDPAASDTEFRYRMRHRDGSWVWFLSRGRIERDRGGSPVSWTGISWDITRQVQSEEALRRAKEDAEAASRAKSSFLANVSHDIRSPLTSIIGMSEVLIEDAPGEIREGLEIIYSSGERLLETLNSVLELARLEGRNEPLELEPVEVAPLVAGVAQVFGVQAEGRGLKLENRVKEPGLVIRADRGALDRILINLLSNALKYTRSGSITIEACERDGQVGLSVRDTGVGIDAAFLPKIYDAFERDGSQLSGGLSREDRSIGLGLSVVRRLVALQEAGIEVESRSGEGTCFTVYFERAADGAAVAAAGGDEGTGGTGPGRPPVLVVEDDREQHRLLRRMLEGEVELVFAGEYDEAVELAGGRAFAAMLVDINLGEERTGVDLLRQLRGQEATRRTPAIACTAHSMPEDEEHFYEAGFDGYLAKPYRKAGLIGVLREAIAAGTRG